MSKVKVGINGFGRIGFLTLRAALEHPEVEVVAINHKSRRLKPGADTAAILAHTLKYDSVHGKLADRIDYEENFLLVNGKKIHLYSESEPANIPWQESGAKMIVESTGRFRQVEAASEHIKGGAEKVLVSAPVKGDALTMVMGVNETDYDPEKHHVVSNASCTTNCAAPIAKVLHENYQIVKGLLTTVHAFTNDQQLLDMPSNDLRRGRSAIMSIIPTTTGAAKAIGIVMPDLAGKLNGIAMRVPTPNVSVVDMVLELTKTPSAEEINKLLQAKAAGELKGILGFSELPLVSVDYNGDPRSSIVDGPSTMVIGDNMVKILSWYDNEWGYANRIIDMLAYMASKEIK